GQRATKRSDLYSLGAVLYVLLTGRPPFVGSTSVDIMQKHRFGQFDLPSRYVAEIPPDLDDIVQKLLEKEPEKRIPDAMVLAKRLDELVAKQNLRFQDQPTTAEDRSPVDAARPRSGAGEATLMRDLVRSELTRSDADSLWRRLLDSTWVL